MVHFDGSDKYLVAADVTSVMWVFFLRLFRGETWLAAFPDAGKLIHRTRRSTGPTMFYWVRHTLPIQ